MVSKCVETNKAWLAALGQEEQCVKVVKTLLSGVPQLIDAITEAAYNLLLYGDEGDKKDRKILAKLSKKSVSKKRKVDLLLKNKALLNRIAKYAVAAIR